MYSLNQIAPWLPALALVVACAANDAQPGAPPDAVGPTMDPVTVVAVDSATAAKQDSIKASRIEVPHIPGRNTRDSLALVRTIRSGMRDKRWPVPGPAPLPGSILPSKRIVAYYGNPLS